MPLGQGGELRYVRVANNLRERIQEGAYQPGTQLPRQHDLAKEQGVSFGTLKVALDLLEREGYLIRKVGQGTYAALPTKKSQLALVIDDDENFCAFTVEALAACGWDSSVAYSCEMALETLQSRDFNVVLLDLIMPGMDGARIFHEIRRINQDIPVIIVTGYPDSQIMMEALKVGPFAVVRKPFLIYQLHHMLSHLSGAPAQATAPA